MEERRESLDALQVVRCPTLSAASSSCRKAFSEHGCEFGEEALALGKGYTFEQAVLPTLARAWGDGRVKLARPLLPPIHRPQTLAPPRIQSFGICHMSPPGPSRREGPGLAPAYSLRRASAISSSVTAESWPAKLNQVNASPVSLEIN
jgi:hypothetical protein